MNYQLGLNDDNNRNQLTQIVPSGVRESESGGALTIPSLLKKMARYGVWVNSDLANLVWKIIIRRNSHRNCANGVRQVSAGHTHYLSKMMGLFGEWVQMKM